MAEKKKTRQTISPKAVRQAILDMQELDFAFYTFAWRNSEAYKDIKFKKRGENNESI